MPLTARLRDEENERINNILKKLIGTDYVPERGNAVINELLSGVGLSLQMMLDLQAADLVSELQQRHFDFENAEQFADFLVGLSSKLHEDQFALTQKAAAIYQFVQTESKTFSWTIQNKITQISKTR